VPGPTEIILGSATERRVHEHEIADLLVARGYVEVVNYTFIDEHSQQLVSPGAESVRLANPISTELSVMRGSLWPGLIRSVRQNMSRQQARCRLFEIGTQFRGEQGKVAETPVVAGVAAGPNWPEHWDSPRRDTDFYDIKRDVELLLGLTRHPARFSFERGSHSALKPSQTACILQGDKVVGWLGYLHPKLRRELDLRTDAVVFSLELDALAEAVVPKAKPVSKYPSVRRDLAVVVDDEVLVRDLIGLVERAAGERLKDVIVFDVYSGEGVESRRKSIGLGLILQDASRTLTDEDADGMVGSVMHVLEHELGASIRT
jgi:phenylalanyl-tRNA synthetase beta chain